MPPRSITLAIVAFWLAVVGLFLAREVWPRLSPTEPQMFPVDLVDEAGRQEDRIDWVVSKNGGGGYRASTIWTYVPEDDTFRSRCQIAIGNRKLERNRKLALPGLPQFHQVQTDSSYYLTRAGRMTRLEARTTDVLTLPGPSGERIEVTAKVSGTLDAGRFVPRVAVSCSAAPGEGKSERPVLRSAMRDADPAPVPGRGIVLDPLHPPRRFPDLRAGQSWRVTLIDPFAVLDLVGLLGPEAHDLLRHAGIAPDAVATVLDARVLHRVESFYWKERSNEVVPCRVIRCTAGDDPFPELTLWVRQRDGALMKQKAITLSGDEWVFTRRPAGYHMELATPEPEYLANLVGQTLAAQALAPAGAPLGAPAQHIAAFGVMGADVFAQAGH
jgi:hypothetical protein